MKVKDIAAAIERIVPLELAQDWDNVGLLVGDAGRKVKRVLLTIDVTADVVAEARKLKTDLIVSYHPIIWDGLKKVTVDGSGSAVYDLIRAGISVFSIHTALDTVAGGVNDGLAEILGIEDAKPLGDYVDTPGGGTYTFDELGEDLAASGFSNTEFVLQGEFMSSVLRATKP